ncbi:MAG: putative quinol monooxygenase [Methylocystaceae bacterium]
MIVVIATFKAKVGSEQALEDTIKGMVNQVQAETDTLAYTLHRSPAENGKFMLYEMYKDQAAFDFHGSQSYFKEFGRAIRDLLEERVKIEIYESIAALNR